MTLNHLKYIDKDGDALIAVYETSIGIIHLSNIRNTKSDFSDKYESVFKSIFETDMDIQDIAISGNHQYIAIQFSDLMRDISVRLENITYASVLLRNLCQKHTFC